MNEKEKMIQKAHNLVMCTEKLALDLGLNVLVITDCDMMGFVNSDNESIEKMLNQYVRLKNNLGK